MYTLADLEAVDRNIRVGTAFVLNQRRIISEHAELGMPTTKDEHWLAVFSNGLERHRLRRAEIVDHLNSGAHAPRLFPDPNEIDACYHGLRDLGGNRQAYIWRNRKQRASDRTMQPKALAGS